MQNSARFMFTDLEELMDTFGYPEALHCLFEEGRHVVLSTAATSWYLKLVRPHNPVASVPVIVRCNHAKGPRAASWAPWAPNNADVHAASYRLRSGEVLSAVTYREGSSAWAFSELLYCGQSVRRKDWPGGMHIRDIERLTGRSVVLLTLSNGKEVEGEFHPDFFDLAGKWELHTDIARGASA